MVANKGSGIENILEIRDKPISENKEEVMEECEMHKAVSAQILQTNNKASEKQEESSFSLTDYLMSAGQKQSVVHLEGTPGEKSSPEPGISSLEVEEVTFSAVYDYYNQQPEFSRSLSPESEMSIEISSTCSDEVAELERFYTPSSTDNPIAVKSADSFHTPCGTPEGYVTPPQYSFSPVESKRPSSGVMLDRLFSPPKIFRSPEDEGIETTPLTLSAEERSSVTEGRSSGAFGSPLDMEHKVQGIPPAFMKPLSKRRVYERGILTFFVEVTGIPSPEVQWYRNNVLLSSDHRQKIEREGDVCSLEIQVVSRSDEGEYLCEAINAIGEARSVAMVEVVSQDAKVMAAPPAVTHQHVIEFDVEEDITSRSPSPQEILLEVELDENEVKEFEKQIKIVTIPEFSPDNKSMIISLDVLPSLFDENTVDFVTQESDELKIAFEVTEMPPRFINPIFDLEVPDGMDAVFECSLAGVPLPKVVWFKDTVPIPKDGRKYIYSSKNDSHILKVRSVCSYDSGMYMCKAVNPAGETTCKAFLSISNHVAEKGAVIVGGGRQQAQQFDLVVGSQPSEIELEFEFDREAKNSQKSVKLIAMTDHDDEQQGDKCVSINIDMFSEPSKEEQIEFKAKESESCSFQFQVTETSPKCLKPLLDVTAATGSSVVLQCVMNGMPKPSATWYKDNRVIDTGRYIIQETESGGYHLIIPSAGKGDTGQFKCVVTNKVGSASTACRVNVT
ncbi:UNC89 protein, partial [Polypterus senegalus]